MNHPGMDEWETVQYDIDTVEMQREADRKGKVMLKLDVNNGYAILAVLPVFEGSKYPSYFVIVLTDERQSVVGTVRNLSEREWSNGHYFYGESHRKDAMQNAYFRADMHKQYKSEKASGRIRELRQVELDDFPYIVRSTN